MMVSTLEPFKKEITNHFSRKEAGHFGLPFVLMHFVEYKM